MTRIANMLAVVVVTSSAIVVPLEPNSALAMDIPENTQTLNNEIDASLARAKGYVDQVEAFWEQQLDSFKAHAERKRS